MGLDIHMIGAEELLAALDGQGFHDIHIFTAAVVALGRISFRVLVGHDASLGREDRFAHEVFRGDHLQLAGLPPRFLPDGPGHLWINLK